MFKTPIILLIVFYALGSALTLKRPKKNLGFEHPASENSTSGVNIKESWLKLLTGILGVMMLDFGGGGDPLWPALGLITCFAAESYPMFKPNRMENIGMIYLGGVIYLYPVIALTSAGLAFQLFIFTKDWLMTKLLFISFVPVLFQYSQVDPLFFGAVIIVEILFMVYFRTHLWQRLSGGN